MHESDGDACKKRRLDDVPQIAGLAVNQERSSYIKATFHELVHSSMVEKKIAVAIRLKHFRKFSYLRKPGVECLYYWLNRKLEVAEHLSLLQALSENDMRAAADLIKDMQKWWTEAAIAGRSRCIAEEVEDRRLAEYPNIPLSEYRSNGDHLPVNLNYPGLRAIHKDPWIFLVPGILTRYECEQLMIKAGTRVESSDLYSNSHRTSSECRIAKEETSGIQSRYSELLGVLPVNMEAAKVSCYKKGQYFKNHVDPLSNMSYLENRIATLFVYLNTCDSGGETRFLSLPSKRRLNYTVGEKVCCLIHGEGDFPGVIKALHPDHTVDVGFDDGDELERVQRTELRAYETLSVKPMQGLGVLFFPAFLPSSPMAMKSYKQLDRYLVHESCTAIDEKWVHQQWVWPSFPQAHGEGMLTNGIVL